MLRPTTHQAEGFGLKITRMTKPGSSRILFKIKQSGSMNEVSIYICIQGKEGTFFSPGEVRFVLFLLTISLFLLFAWKYRSLCSISFLSCFKIFILLLITCYKGNSYYFLMSTIKLPKYPICIRYMNLIFVNLQINRSYKAFV